MAKRDETALCKYFLIGCPRKKGSCPFCHDKSELKVRWCHHKNRCFHDRRKHTEGRKCCMFHPGEKPTQDDIYARAMEYCTPITYESIYLHTSLCKDGLVCKKENCSDAHSTSELKDLVCPYRSLCKGSSCPFHRRVQKVINWGDDDEEIDFSQPLVFHDTPFSFLKK